MKNKKIKLRNTVRKKQIELGRATTQVHKSKKKYTRKIKHKKNDF